MKFFYLILVLYIAPVFMSGKLAAHEPENSYIYLSIYTDSIVGRVEFSKEEFPKIVEGQVLTALTQEHLEFYSPVIKAYLKQNISFKNKEKKYPISFRKIGISLHRHIGKKFIACHFLLDEMDMLPEYLDIQYSAFMQSDVTHRGMLIIHYNWEAGIINNESSVSLIFSPSETQQRLSFTGLSIWRGISALTMLGLWHIWTGWDHILFLVALILPAVVRRKSVAKQLSSLQHKVPAGYSTVWLPVRYFKPTFWYIIAIMSSFTVAHSLTLGLVALDILRLPDVFVESVITISVALAAWHNISPIFNHKEWVVAFIFGLFHGFGFAGALANLGMQDSYLLLSLLGFNLGVELGQLIIIVLLLPILFMLRKYSIYPRLITWGSVALLLIAIFWGIEKIMTFM